MNVANCVALRGERMSGETLRHPKFYGYVEISVDYSEIGVRLNGPLQGHKMLNDAFERTHLAIK